LNSFRSELLREIFFINGDGEDVSRFVSFIETSGS